MQSGNNLPSMLLAAYERDPDINLHESPIRVSIRDGLRLEGVVSNIIVKRKARRIALQLSGLSEIEDHLQLRTADPRTGKALLDAVVSALSQEPAFRDMTVHPIQPLPESEVANGWIGVSVDEQRVRLGGTVGSLSHRRLAEVITWWVPGCSDVRNHLRVRPAEKDNDDELSDAILLVLEKDPLLHAEDIHAHIKHRGVTLTGTVHSEEQQHMAIHDCWYVPGVHEVHSELQVARS